jgi:hypothetical protein
MTQDLGLAFGATGPEESAGERVATRYRAPHPTPYPIIKKTHPTAAHHTRAAQHAAKPKHQATHHRATVVSGAGPYLVQLATSDTTVTIAAAQHIAAGTVAPGTTVLVAVLDEANPADALIVAAY